MVGAAVSRSTTKNLEAWRALSQSDRTAALAAARDRLGLKPERESAMADDDTVDRKLAGVLSELEDVATELTQKETKLAKELQAVQTELERINNVRAAIMGSPPPQRRQPYAGNASKTRQNREKVGAFVAALSNGQTFSARQLAEAIDVDLRGVGPILSGMVRRGDVRQAEGETDTGHKLYQRA
jgi:hypothetical protein